MATETVKLLNDDFVAKIKSIRDILDKQNSKIIKVLLEENREWVYDYVWGDVLQKDKKQLLEELKLAQECWYTTKENAIKRYMDITDPKELQDFISLIEQDNDKWINNNWNEENKGQSNKIHQVRLYGSCFPKLTWNLHLHCLL